MTRYAENSRVPVDRSKAEIERLVMRYGADQFVRGSSLNPRAEAVAFKIHGWNIKLEIPMPDPEDKRYKLTPTGKARTEEIWHAEYEKEIRRRWRALVLLVKAQLEAIELGIITLEEAFFANIVVPGGQRLIEAVKPKLDQAYKSGQARNLLEFKV